MFTILSLKPLLHVMLNLISMERSESGPDLLFPISNLLFRLTVHINENWVNGNWLCMSVCSITTPKRHILPRKQSWLQNENKVKYCYGTPRIFDKINGLGKQFQNDGKNKTYIWKGINEYRVKGEPVWMTWNWNIGLPETKKVLRKCMYLVWRYHARSGRGENFNLLK